MITHVPKPELYSPDKHREFTLLVAESIGPADWPPAAARVFCTGETLVFLTEGLHGSPQSWDAHRLMLPPGPLDRFLGHGISRQEIQDAWTEIRED